MNNQFFLFDVRSCYNKPMDKNRCTSCGEAPKKCSCKNKEFTKAVVEINNPDEVITLMRKVVIPASMGDDTTVPPEIGKYKNVLLYYEANSKSYLYSSDGIPTLLANGVTDYEQAVNLPQINGVTLIGDKTGGQLGLQPTLSVAPDTGIKLENNELSGLPATDTTIGMVKPGDGLEVDANGTMSISNIEQYAHFFDTVADMKAATNLVDGDYVKTLGYRNINDGGEALYKVREIVSEEPIDEGSVIALNDATLVAELIAEEVNPIMFGAYGDGTNNDYTYFKNCFDYANANKLNIKLIAKTYKITGNRLTLKTNLDGNGAVIISNDNDAGVNVDEPLIHIVSDNEFTDEVLDNAYIFRTYPDHANIWKRSGNTPEAEAGVVPQECNVKIKNTLLYSYFFDFSSPVEQYRLLDTNIVVKNLVIDKTVIESSGTSYIKRNILVERDNVLLDSIVFNLTDNNTNTAPYLGLIKLNKCYNVRLSNCVVPAMLTNSSYAFHTSYDVKTIVENCYLNSENDCWGATSSNGAVDITYSKCNVNRIDAHQGFFGLTVKDCYIGKEGVVLTGGVYALIERCHFNSRRCVSLREDYGSGFNGVITLKDCDGIVTNQEIVYLKSDIDFDYGYTWKCPSFIIEDCNINASSGVITALNFTVDSDSSLKWYSARNNVRIVNLNSNRNIRVFNCLPHIFGDCEITLENVYARTGIYSTYVASASNYNIYINANKCTVRYPKTNSTVRINGIYVDCEMLDLEFIHLNTVLVGGRLQERDSITAGYTNSGKRLSMFNFGLLITEASVTAWHENSYNFKTV